MASGPQFQCAKCGTKPAHTVRHYGTIHNGEGEVIGRSVFVRIEFKCHGKTQYENGRQVLEVLQSGNDYVVFGG